MMERISLKYFNEEKQCLLPLYAEFPTALWTLLRKIETIHFIFTIGILNFKCNKFSLDPRTMITHPKYPWPWFTSISDNIYLYPCWSSIPHFSLGNRTAHASYCTFFHSDKCFRIQWDKIGAWRAWRALLNFN